MVQEKSVEKENSPFALKIKMTRESYTVAESMAGILKPKQTTKCFSQVTGHTCATWDSSDAHLVPLSHNRSSE